MSFMQPKIQFVNGYNVDTDQGIQFVNSDFVGIVENDELEEIEDSGELGVFADYVEGRECYSVEDVTGYLAELSAPGYMDRLELGVFPTESDAARELILQFYDVPDDEMTDDQQKESEWLTSLMVNA